MVVINELTQDLPSGRRRVQVRASPTKGRFITRTAHSLGRSYFQGLGPNEHYQSNAEILSNQRKPKFQHSEEYRTENFQFQLDRGAYDVWHGGVTGVGGQIFVSTSSFTSTFLLPSLTFS
jgi:hypothetical protein